MALIYPFAFEPERALASLLYLAAKLPRPTLHSISKLLYFADKRHLWKYGCLMFGDRYVAMENGPVPSAIYDMMKAVRDNACVQSVRGIPMEQLKQSLSVTEFHVTPLQAANAMKLSESNWKCMDWAVEEYGNCTFDELTDRSHDETWAETAPNSVISVEAMTIGVKHREALLEYLRDPYPGTAEELSAS
ncbi:MAG: Panacea domain-containing protein [Deltaproteobacteria bacterium]|nr:Panacea domain-containing protein [Deltaproteobacteria bacterium]